MPSSAASDGSGRFSYPSPIEASPQRQSFQQQPHSGQGQQQSYQPSVSSSVNMTNPISELSDMQYLGPEISGVNQTAQLDGQTRSELGGRQIYEVMVDENVLKF